MSLPSYPLLVAALFFVFNNSTLANIDPQTVEIVFIGHVDVPATPVRGFPEFAGTLLHELETNLKSHGINLFYLDGENLTENRWPDIVIGMSELNADTSIIYINTIKPAEFAMSDILIPHYSFGELSLGDVFGLSVSPHNFASQKILIALATALSMYSINRCDLSEGYFQTTQREAEKIETDDLAEQTTAFIDFYQGTCALMQGELKIARDYFQASLDKDPTITIATVINMVWLLLQEGDENSAIDLIERTKESVIGDHKSILLLTRTAQLYALATHYDDAINGLTAAIQLSPDDPALYTLRGQMYLYLYEWDQVLTDYNTAIELDPAYADAYYFRGVLYYTRNELDQALADFQHYLELDPNSDHAEQAAQSITDIQTQQQALEDS